jgi:hypothetical protein
MKRVLFVIVFTIASTALAVPTASAQSAAATTEGFYAKLAELRVRGLPTHKELALLAPYLDPQIVSLVKRDRRKQAAFVKRYPDEKPPWIEGDLFSSLFEGTSTYKVGRERMVSGSRHVDVDLSYTGDGQTSRWTDTAVLKKIAGKWRITNILYNGKWQFKNGSSLLKVLK